MVMQRQTCLASAVLAACLISQSNAANLNRMRNDKAGVEFGRVAPQDKLEDADSMFRELFDFDRMLSDHSMSGSFSYSMSTGGSGDGGSGDGGSGDGGSGDAQQNTEIVTVDPNTGTISTTTGLDGETLSSALSIGKTSVACENAPSAAGTDLIQLNFKYSAETTNSETDFINQVEKEIMHPFADEILNCGANRKLQMSRKLVITKLDSLPADKLSTDDSCTAMTPGAVCMVVDAAITIEHSGSDKDNIMATFNSIVPQKINEGYYIPEEPTNVILMKFIEAEIMTVGGNQVSTNSGMSGGAKAGTVIGSILGLLVAGAIGYTIYKRSTAGSSDSSVTKDEKSIDTAELTKTGASSLSHMEENDIELQNVPLEVDTPPLSTVNE
eukprot:CAMPEP_0198304396 /NCGR_PEP_ID=MMETSP1449-20131203/57373_1 /TAXON_ID=420275 /ORGANISM="Attheya septentrionalis, Strain CCMP2084" /LENGTH=383 /DNA_ID=CAMNT_0044006917 /DNA_START=486 /DNA_END=1637 /DNA_ORIENTATION=-